MFSEILADTCMILFGLAMLVLVKDLVNDFFNFLTGGK